jgi:hypothetical protein
MQNISLNENNFNQTSPLKPFILDIYAGFLIITFFLCVICNSFLLITFIRFKELRLFSLNLLIIAISVCNLIGSLQFPALIYSNFVRK